MRKNLHSESRGEVALPRDATCGYNPQNWHERRKPRPGDGRWRTLPRVRESGRLLAGSAGIFRISLPALPREPVLRPDPADELVDLSGRDEYGSRYPDPGCGCGVVGSRKRADRGAGGRSPGLYRAVARAGFLSQIILTPTMRRTQTLRLNGEARRHESTTTRGSCRFIQSVRSAMPLRNLVWLLVVPGLVGLGLA